jgi:hypothetical protein
MPLGGGHPIQILSFIVIAWGAVLARVGSIGQTTEPDSNRPRWFSENIVGDDDGARNRNPTTPQSPFLEVRKSTQALRRGLSRPFLSRDRSRIGYAESFVATSLILRSVAVLVVSFGTLLVLGAFFSRTRSRAAFSLAAFSAATVSATALSKRACFNRAVLAAARAGAARYSSHAFAPSMAHSFRFISTAVVGFTETRLRSKRHPRLLYIGIRSTLRQYERFPFNQLQ